MLLLCNFKQINCTYFRPHTAPCSAKKKQQQQQKWAAMNNCKCRRIKKKVNQPLSRTSVQHSWRGFVSWLFGTWRASHICQVRELGVKARGGQGLPGAHRQTLGVAWRRRAQLPQSPSQEDDKIAAESVMIVQSTSQYSHWTPYLLERKNVKSIEALQANLPHWNLVFKRKPKSVW